jgi:hypothetical protein
MSALSSHTVKQSGVDIRRIFGVGDGAMIVDNAASCVVAAVNTYQRRYAIQAAQEDLTWRLVSGQLVESDERAEVQRTLVDAEGKLKEKSSQSPEFRRTVVLLQNLPVGSSHVVNLEERRIASECALNISAHEVKHPPILFISHNALKLGLNART